MPIPPHIRTRLRTGRRRGPRPLLIFMRLHGSCVDKTAHTVRTHRVSPAITVLLNPFSTSFQTWVGTDGQPYPRRSTARVRVSKCAHVCEQVCVGEHQGWRRVTATQPGRGGTPLFCCPGGGSFQTRPGDYYCQRCALCLSTCARCNVNPLDFLPFLFHLRNSSLIPWYLVSHCFSRL